MKRFAKVFSPLSQYLVDALLAAITALSLCSFAHLDIALFLHCSDLHSVVLKPMLCSFGFIF